MVHYTRILSRIHNAPLAIAESKLDIIASKVIIPLLLSEKVLSDNSIEPTNKPIAALENREDTKIINVFDSLVSKGGAGESGYTSYQGIQSNIEAAIKNGANKIVFYMDSPGGEVTGLFGLAEYIAALPKKYGVKTSAIVDGLAASAAYVIAASTQEIHATESSILGSIGVIMTRVNLTKMDEQNGIQYQILRSKSEKALGNPHEPISDKATQDAIDLLAKLDKQMNENINRYRPSVSMNTIMQLNGNTVLAEEAMNLGLIDGIVSSFTEGLAKVRDNKLNFINSKTGANMPRTLEEYQAEEQKLLGELNKLKTDAKSLVDEAVKGEQTRILSILEAGEKFKINGTAIKKRITANTSVSDALSMFEDIAEATQTAKGDIPIIAHGETITPDVIGLTEDQKFLANLMAGVEAINKQPKMEIR